MIILNKNEKPQNTVYYIAGCILNELSKEVYTIDELFEQLKMKYNNVLEYNIYMLAINFLFLLNKLQEDQGVLICI